ncbi:hypothetical protein UPYG_G00217520 [Umbra pygmaea]|uniref:Saxitoxin and tetrodotoxin-binding protein 1-like n=1 Tax=Umbra pygmaea TaxID=75934 RepID=A0ABD0X8Z5_UMBPY
MCALFNVVLLALVSMGTADPEDCKHLLQPLAPGNQQTIFGKWVFLEGFSDNEVVSEILRNTSSSWIQISPTSENETVLLDQRNLIEGNCMNSSANMTFSKSSFQVTHDNISITGHFLQTCTDCLAIMHSGDLMAGVHFQALYIFGKNKTLPHSDLEHFRKQAQCLKYAQPAPYSYSGVTELCSETEFACC